MPKIIFFSIFFIIGWGPTDAQSYEEVRLRKLTLSVSNDTNFVLSAITLGGMYKNSLVDSALFLAEKALIVSRSINYKKGEVLSLNLEGVLHVRLGNYTRALESFLKALQICDKTDLKKPTSMVLTNLGDLYYKQNDIKKAIEYTLKAKVISESIHDTINLTAIYINIGNYYEELNLFDSARLATELGRSYAEKVSKPDDTSIAQNYIGLSLNNLGNINFKTKQNPLSLEYYRSSLSYFLKTEDYESISDSYLGMAKVYHALNNKDSSIFYAKKSLSTANSQKFIKYIFDASTFISQYYYANHQIDSAFAYQQTMIAANDSLFSQEKVKQLQMLTINESLRQQELAEEKLRAAEERQNNLQYMAIAAFIFIFALIIILVSRQRIRLTTINFLVTVALLLVFEYISLLIHPTISFWTHHSPVYMLLILVGIASILVPMHHRLEHWIKETLAHKIVHPRARKIKIHHTDAV